MTYYEKAKDVYDMSTKGKMLEAFDKYYHNDVVMQEADGKTRKGKSVNREYEVQFISNIKEMHNFEVTSLTSDEKAGVTMVESWFDATFNDGNRFKMEEVAVQRWQGDQIINERFYYNMAQ